LSGAAVVILVCVTTAPALDACLAALDRSLTAGTPVLVADDAGGDPCVAPLAQSWCERTRLSAHFLRRDRPYGRARHRGYLLADHPGQDLVLLDGDALPAPGWLEALQRCASAHPDVATLSTWSNGAGLCSFPRFCEANPLPTSLDTVAAAAAKMDDEALPELPMAQGPCLYLRADALRRLGSWDCDSFETLGADADFCHRAASMGWRNVLCPTVFVGRSESAVSEPVGDDLRRLSARWPSHQEDLARFLLSDPLYPLREKLTARLAELIGAARHGGPQGDLFD
jgi:glycosyltransferase involved in cell wall biosynthesis